MREPESVPLLPGLSASVCSEGEARTVWLCAEGLPLQIVLNGIYDKPAFKLVLAEFDAAEVLTIDGQGYRVAAGDAEPFLAALKTFFEPRWPKVK